MNKNSLHKLLLDLYNRKVNPEQAIEQLSTLPYENLDFAKVDHHRIIRNGLPEVIFGKGKTDIQLIAIIQSLYKAGTDVLATKIKPEVYEQIKSQLPIENMYHKASLTLTISKCSNKHKLGKIIILTAGTSDFPIAEEAQLTAQLFGSDVEIISDVGVAGIHRIFEELSRLRQARVIIVIAGMDGALASVVGGLVSCPIIGVPTSVGYGASFDGIAPLLTMLNSCAIGIATVNIDNGFGAGCIAHKINLLGELNSTQTIAPNLPSEK